MRVFPVGGRLGASVSGIGAGVGGEVGAADVLGADDVLGTPLGAFDALGADDMLGVPLGSDELLGARDKVGASVGARVSHSLFLMEESFLVLWDKLDSTCQSILP